VDDEALDYDAEEVTDDDVAYPQPGSHAHVSQFGDAWSAWRSPSHRGGLEALAWLWVTIRTQQHYDSRGFSLGRASGARRGSLTDRCGCRRVDDWLLVSSALACGVGMVVLLISNHSTVDYGGTLSGFEAGDPFPRTRDEPAERWLTENLFRAAPLFKGRRPGTSTRPGAGAGPLRGRSPRRSTTTVLTVGTPRPSRRRYQHL